MANVKQQNKKDYWSTDTYKNAASFVPELTTTVIKYLDAQPADLILDIGCGDGTLTAQIAKDLSTGRILGLDASQSFINTANAQNRSSNCTYDLQDCARLKSSGCINGLWDKVFSNAALHWILRNEDTRHGLLRDVHQALKPGGKFVFEMGGKGNVAEIHAAFNSALLHHGVPIETVRAINPWFFPSTDWMTGALQDAGFHVDICELEYRPTRTLDASEHEGQGSGLTGWLRLMGAQFLEAAETEKQDSVIRHVDAVLEDVLTREEDGSKWLGYVRLRAVATKRVN